MKYDNNPLNIRSLGKGRWIGQTGVQNGFCLFSDVCYCIRTALILILRNYRKRNILTIEDIISTWAPVSDGNNPYVYTSYVCQHSGCTRHQCFKDLSHRQQYDVLKAMCGIETCYFLSTTEFNEGYRLYEEM